MEKVVSEQWCGKKVRHPQETVVVYVAGDPPTFYAHRYLFNPNNCVAAQDAFALASAQARTVLDEQAESLQVGPVIQDEDGGVTDPVAWDRLLAVCSQNSLTTA